MTLPRQNSRLIDDDGRPTREFYDWMRRLETVAPTSATPTSLNSLTNVAISTPADGDVLTYNNTTGKWLNEVPSGGGGGYDEGTSFPGSPASGDKFYRTDLNWLCFYDGTRWLTENVYSETFGMQANNLPAAVTPFTIAYVATRRDKQLYLERATIHSFIVTTNSGANYWTFDLRWANSANVQTSIATSNTSAGAANTNLDNSITINAPLSTSSFYIELQAVKTGTPGSLYAWGSLTYRLIVT